MSSLLVSRLATLNRSDTRAFLAGWLAFSGLLLPYFGHAFSVFGVHNRILAFVFLVCAMIVGLERSKIDRATLLVLSLVVLHFLLAFAYASPDQVRSVLQLSTERVPYEATKLSSMVLTNALPILMGLLLARLAASAPFRAGIVSAMVTWAAVALVVGLLNSSYWFTPASSSLEEWGDLYQFSTIGMTLVLMAGFLTGLVALFQGRQKTLSLLLVLSTLLLIVVYRQRAAWIYAFGVILFLVAHTMSVRFGAGLKAAFAMSVVGLIGYLAIEMSGALTSGVVSQAQTIFGGSLFSSRTPLIRLAAHGIWEHPLGQGLASFASVAPATLYPHNVILEAFFELGLADGIVMILILSLLIRSMIRLVLERDGGLPAMVIGLYVGYVVVYGLKSGDLTSTELLLSLTLLFSGSPRAGTERNVWSAEIPTSQT